MNSVASSSLRFLSVSRVALLCVVTAASTSAMAQVPAQQPSQTQLDRVEVALWPEYDKPSVLVIVRAWVAAKATLPATVAVKIPAKAGMPHAVAKRAQDGTLLLAPHTREVNGAWATIHVVTDVPELRVEYYADLQIAGTQRSFTYEWPAGFDIGQFTYEVQQPVGATVFTVTPPPAQQGAGNDGLTYHRAELGKIAMQDAAKVAVVYTKTGPGLSVAALQPTSPTPAMPNVPPPAPVAPAHPGEDSSTWIVVVLVGLLVAIGAAWVALSGKKDDGTKSSS